MQVEDFIALQQEAFVPHIWRECRRTRIACDVVAAERLFARKSKLIVEQLEENNFAVHRLAYDPLFCKHIV